MDCLEDDDDTNFEDEVIDSFRVDDVSGSTEKYADIAGDNVVDDFENNDVAAFEGTDGRGPDKSVLSGLDVFESGERGLGVVRVVDVLKKPIEGDVQSELHVRFQLFFAECVW